MMARSRLMLLALVQVVLGACASSGELRCKPTDNSIALCQLGSHEECEHQDNGCERCTCVPDRLEEPEHGPAGPR